jgi:hypothetical protein
MMLSALVVCSSCAWRGDTKFVASTKSYPPGPNGVETDTWTVDLDAKRITFDTEATRTLSDAQVSSIKSALGALKPASKESCLEDGQVRIIELPDGQTRYAEQKNACSSNSQGAYLYVESLNDVFVQIAKAAQ